jgi:hypothetical protein
MAAPSEAASSISRRRRPRSGSSASASSSPRGRGPQGQNQRLHLHEGRPARLPARGHQRGQGPGVGEAGQELVERRAPVRVGRVGGDLAGGADDADGLREAAELQGAEVDLPQAAEDERLDDLGRDRGHVEQGRDHPPLDGVVALGVGTEGVRVRRDVQRDDGEVHRRLLGQQGPVVLGVVAVDVLLAEEGGQLGEVGRRLGRGRGRPWSLLLRLRQGPGHLEGVTREALLAGQPAQAAEHVGGG